MRRNLTSSRSRITTIASVALLGSACAWVKLTPGGEGVDVGTAMESASCERLGATHAKTSSKAGIFARRPKKIDQELEYLARNEAADMGGDTIVPQGPASAEGRRSFDVFRCKAL